MKAFVTGANGQLGRDLCRELLKRGHICVGCGLQETSGLAGMAYYQVDIGDAAAVGSAILGERPDIVFHCAAWTAVDAAEEPENREAVFRANGLGSENVAAACKKAGCKLLYTSTDYVFGGKGEAPWQPDCRDFAPLNVYGESKLMGERAVAALEKFFVVRIAWVFGPGESNFVKTMLRLSESHNTLRVVCDQVGTPTYTPDLARLLCDIGESGKYGFYHATNGGGYISWYDFAQAIFQAAGRDVRVLPVTTEEYGAAKALRPKNSRLDQSKLAQAGFTPLPHWRDALERYLRIGSE